MKKIISLFLVFIFLLTSVTAVFAAEMSFSDLASEHWAYSYITKLVGMGTIKGYEDGSFRPDKLVSRAEFVKMIGEGSEIRQTPYKDVAANHWGYSYIMSSGIKADVSGNFYPDTPITRETVIEVLWKRNSGKEDVFAPSIITNQASNKSAVSWAYAYGLMQGDDGVNLRLSDGLKRSEAAALIVRASQIDEQSQKKDFKDVLNTKIIENVYNVLSPIDMPYSENSVVTNGEMARAALKIGCEESSPSYFGFSANPSIEHKYAKDLAILGKYCIGDDKITAEFADSPAKVKDTVAFLAYNFIRKSSKAWNISAKTEELNGKVSDTVNSLLTFADKNGIIRISEINLDETITHKDLTILLILFDAVIGIQSDITTDINKVTQANIKKNHSMVLSTYNKYPDFALGLKDMPKSVYTTAFNALDGETALPKDTFKFVKDYNMAFVGMLQKYVSAIKKHSGVQVRFTLYPSMCFDNGDGYTLRVKCEFVSLEGTKSLADIFPKVSESISGISVKQGDSYFVDVQTGIEVASMDIPADNVYVDKVMK